jgi:endonuclease III related protein
MFRTHAITHATPAILDLPQGRGYLSRQMSSLVPRSKLMSAPGVVTTQYLLRLPGRLLPPQPVLRSYYDALFAAYGPQHWWPGRSRFEIIVGAILVQNTSWSNVKPAIENLRREKLLTARAIETVPFARLARLIRSSGYFRQKTKKLKAFVHFLNAEHQGSLTKMFRTPTAVLREQLLAVHGIGPETADSILLYAGQHPVFVVDAYARRMLERHGLAEPAHGYESIRQLFEHSVPDATLYNDFHALIVHIGKHYCRPRVPRCDECALKSLLPEGGAIAR